MIKRPWAQDILDKESTRLACDRVDLMHCLNCQFIYKLKNDEMPLCGNETSNIAYLAGTLKKCKYYCKLHQNPVVEIFDDMTNPKCSFFSPNLEGIDV